MSVSTWSTSPAANAAAPPHGWPEGMAPSAVNDTARQMMADLRAQFEDAEWFDRGDGAAFFAFASPTLTLTISGDATGPYHAGRRLRASGSATGTVCGTIASAGYAAPNTTVTVTVDGGTVVNEALAVALGIASAGGARSVHADAVVGLGTLGRQDAGGVAVDVTMDGASLVEARAVVSAGSTTDLASAAGNVVQVENAAGDATVASLGAGADGLRKLVRFIVTGGSVTLTHDADSLYLPGGADIAVANGDTAMFVCFGAGSWVCTDYQRASGRPLVTGSPFAAWVESAEQSFTAGTTVSVAHGQTGAPKDVSAVLVCKTADAGYAAGQVVRLSSYIEGGGSTNAGVGLLLDATDFVAKVSAWGIYVVHATTYASTLATPANWRLVFRGTW